MSRLVNIVTEIIPTNRKFTLLDLNYVLKLPEDQLARVNSFKSWVVSQRRVRCFLELQSKRTSFFLVLWETRRREV
jgi:hypothetical protein